MGIDLLDDLHLITFCHVTGITCNCTDISFLVWLCGELEVYSYRICNKILVNVNVNALEPVELRDICCYKDWPMIKIMFQITRMNSDSFSGIHFLYQIHRLMSMWCTKCRISTLRDNTELQIVGAGCIHDNFAVDNAQSYFLYWSPVYGASP